MQHRELLEDPHPSRAFITAVLALLVLGIALGALVGVGLSRAIDSANLEEQARKFSRPAAAAPVQPDNLRS